MTALCCWEQVPIAEEDRVFRWNRDTHYTS